MILGENPQTKTTSCGIHHKTFWEHVPARQAIEYELCKYRFMPLHLFPTTIYSLFARLVLSASRCVRDL